MGNKGEKELYNMFKLDSPLMNFLNRLCDVMIINILVLVCSLPIFTFGAAITAAYYMSFKMINNEETYIVRGFFKAFKENFKQSTIMWIIMLAVGLILYGDYKIILDSGLEFASWTRIAILTVTVIVAIGATFIFPMQARFTNTVKNTMKNGFLMALSHLPSAVLFVISFALPALLVYVINQSLPAIILLAFGGLPYLKSYLYLKIFKKYELIIAEKNKEAGIEPKESEDEGIFAASDALEKEALEQEK